MDRGAWWGYSPWGHRELYTTELLTCMCARAHTHMRRLQVLIKGRAKRRDYTQDKIIDQRSPILYYTISETELPFTVSGDQLEAEAELTLPK